MCLLLRKLGTKEHERYTDIILPKNPRDFTFDETIQRLSETFGEKSSLFSIRHQCLKLVKNETEDFLTLASTVNRQCERFKLRELTDDQCKCLIIVSALQSPRDAEIRTRLFSKIEQEPKSTLQTLTADCQRLKNLQHNSVIVEQRSSSFAATSVEAATSTKSMSPQKPQDHTSRKPPSACWQCGEWQFVRFCPFKRHVCQKCRTYESKR